MNIDKASTIKLILLGAGLLFILFFLNKIMSIIGIRKSKTRIEKDEAEENLNTMKYFEPGYYKTVPHKPLGDTMAGQYAKDLNKAWKFFRPTLTVNEDLIFSTFGKLDNKVQISEVANQYYLMRSEDLRSRIMKELNRKEQVKLFNIIQSLPRT